MCPEPSKVDAAFDAVRNHNRLVKEEEDRQQLQLAREMVHGGELEGAPRSVVVPAW